MGTQQGKWRRGETQNNISELMAAVERSERSLAEWLELYVHWVLDLCKVTVYNSKHLKIREAAAYTDHGCFYKKGCECAHQTLAAGLQ